MSDTASMTAEKPTIHPSVMADEQLLEFVPGAVYVCDLDGVVVRYNKRAGELWGRYPVPGDPKEVYCGSHRLYRANGDLMPHDETPMVDALREGNSYRNLEVQVEQPSGRKIWILVNIDPLRDASGGIVGVINCFQDITDRKLADVRQKIMVNELNHRVKNTLATVQSIASHTFRKGTGDEARKWFEGRLMTLSRAHDVLTNEAWETANIREIVSAGMAAHSSVFGDRIVISGPDVQVPPNLALTLAIAFYELSANAVEFGAMSNEKGRIAIGWSVDTATSRKLAITWVESGGPSVAQPTRRGFGSRIIEGNLAHEHDAIVTADYRETGARFEIEVPLP